MMSDTAMTTGPRAGESRILTNTLDFTVAEPGSSLSMRMRSAPPAIVAPQMKFTPAASIKRRVFGSAGMMADVVSNAKRVEIEAHLRSPFHTLVAYESGSRNVDAKVFGRQTTTHICDLAQKLVFVPAGLEYRETHTARTRF